MEKPTPVPQQTYETYEPAPPQYNQQPGQWDHIPALEGAPANYDSGASTGSGPSEIGAHIPADAQAVPLTRLLREPQFIDCPGCNRRAKTKVQGRSKGKQQFMNVFWWPLPNRKTWWEKTHWYCSLCNVEVAMQKDGHDLQVLV